MIAWLLPDAIQTSSTDQASRGWTRLPVWPCNHSSGLGYTHHKLHYGSKNGRVTACLPKGPELCWWRGKINPLPPPSLLNLPSGTKESDRLTRIKGPTLHLFKCLWKQQQFCELKLQYRVRWSRDDRHLTDEYTVPASYCSCSPCIH